MIKFTLLLMILNISVASTPKTLSEAKIEINRFGKKRLVRFLREFVRSSRPNRMVGQKGHQKAVDFLLKSLKKLKGPSATVSLETFLPDTSWAKTTYEKDFENQVGSKFSQTHTLYRKWRRFTDDMKVTLDSYKNVQGKNIIWEKKGTEKPNEVLLIGLHYDNIVRDPISFKIKKNAASDGANDNGAAVAAALGVVDILRKSTLKKTVRIVFFDYEELGFLGSRYHVENYIKSEKAKTEKIVGMFNLEMIGQDTIHNDEDKKLGNMHAYIRKPSSKGYRNDQQFAQKMFRLGKRINRKVNFELVSSGWDRSDHIHFWERGIPAITFTQNWDKDFDSRTYHTSADVVESLNFNTFYNSFEFIAGSTLGWALGL